MVDHYGGLTPGHSRKPPRLENGWRAFLKSAKPISSPRLPFCSTRKTGGPLKTPRAPGTAAFIIKEAVLSHYRAFWELGIPVDIVDMEKDLSGYRLVVAPMLYLYRANIAEKMKDSPKNSGTW